MTSGTTACVVHYNQAGNASYAAATEVTESTTAQKLPLTVTGVTANDKVYDAGIVASLNTGSAVLVGVASGDTVNLNVASAAGAFANKNIGSNKTVTITGITTDANANNYSLSQPSTTASITARALTITANTDTKGYDGTTNSSVAPTITSGVIQGSDANGFSQAFSTKNVGTGKTLVPSGVVNDGNSGNNYTYTFVNNTTGVVTAAPLTLTAQINTKVYDSTTSAAAVPTISGLQTGDSVTSLTETYNTASVGTGKSLFVSTYTVNDGNSGNNYSVLLISTNSGVITARPITVTADAQSKTYGSSDPTLTYQITSGALQGSDTISGSLTRTVGETVASSPYAIAQGTLSAGSNYSLTFVPSTLTINKKALTVSGITASKVYDASTAATLVTSGASFTGVVGSDAVTLDSSAVSAATYADKNVGTGKSISYSGSFALGGADSGNYTLTQPAITGTITQKALTVSATGINKTYDATTAATVTLSDDKISGDTVTDSYTTATFDTKNVGSGKTVSVSGISISGTDAGNYSFNTTAATTATIIQKALTITAQTNTKTYDATTVAAATPLVSGLQGSDTVTGLAETYANANVGTSKTLSVSAYTVNDGNSGNNYAVSSVNDTTGVISQKAITVTATDTSKVYGSSDPALAYTASTLSGSDTYSGTLARVAGETVGTYAIGQGTVNAGSNYNITFTAGTFTITIGPSSSAVVLTTTTNLDGTKSGTTPTSSNTSTSTPTEGKNITVSIPSGLTVTGPSTWDGSINFLPADVGAVSPVAPSGSSVVEQGSINLGFGDSTLTFDKGVRILFSGKAGNLVGYSHGAGTFTEITAACTADTQAAGDALSTGGDCKMDVGSDLVVWTKHFSAFTLYTLKSTTSSSGGGGNGPVAGGGGGGGGSNFSTPASVSATSNGGGEVLGAEGFKFTLNLSLGMHNSDVTELQKLLIAQGFLKVAAPTGWFGPLTQAAVKKYQTAHKISATGFVGPLTRAQLNLDIAKQ